MDWLVEKITDLYRPCYDNGLPEDLQVGVIEAWGFTRGAMLRAARMADGLDIPFGVFSAIGLEYARRAARAWRPHERLLMEDISCAFRPIEDRAASGRPVPQILVDRLVFILSRYLKYVGTVWREEEIRAAIERSIRETPQGNSDFEPEGANSA